MSRLGVLWDADGPGPAVAFKEYEAAARAFKLEFRSFEVRGPNPDLRRSIPSCKSIACGCACCRGKPTDGPSTRSKFSNWRQNIAHRRMTEEARYVNAGGLISYGANLADLYRRSAEYVVEILKGAKPARSTE